jgi:hypothetical protein
MSPRRSAESAGPRLSTVNIAQPTMFDRCKVVLHIRCYREIREEERVQLCRLNCVGEKRSGLGLHCARRIG